MNVKWGVIGCGGIADRRTIPGMMLADNAELVAVMDTNSALAETIREKYNAKAAYNNIGDLLANKEIDAVYIASPVFCHKEQAIAAAKAKKHILIEKPVALTSADGIQIAKICAKEGVLLSVGFMMRFHSYHQKMKEIISAGKIGQIVSARAQLTCWYPEIEGAWRQKKALSAGGAAMDMGIHCIDLIQYITGSKAKLVMAMNGNKNFAYEVEDSSSILFETENGAYCYVDSNFNIPDAAAKCRLEFYGTKGSILAEGTISQVEGGKIEVVASDDTLDYDAGQNRAEVKPLEIKVDFGNMYTKEIESFGRAILNHEPVEVTAEDAVQNQIVVEKAYESAGCGRKIDL